MSSDRNTKEVDTLELTTELATKIIAADQADNLDELDELVAEFYALASYKRKPKDPTNYPYTINDIAPKDFYSKAMPQHGEGSMPYSVDYYKDLMK